jgi:hypothetical protein
MESDCFTAPTCYATTTIVGGVCYKRCKRAQMSCGVDL